MTEEQCFKAVNLHKERNRLIEIINDIEKPKYKLSFIEVWQDEMTYMEFKTVRDMKELHCILNIHHVSILYEIKKRIVNINKEIELL